MEPIETDLLVVGAGPAGGSLGCFLARYGLKGIVISAAPGTADTPRAHITNTAALECLRDIGLEDDCLKLGNRDTVTTHYRWCESMAGEEYARIYAWGNDPARKGDYDRASPCKIMDLPQTLLEPLLVKYATLNGFKVRFDTRLLFFTEDAASSKIISLVKDRVTGAEYRIISNYLFGADGGKSVIANQLDLQQHVIPGGGPAHNVLVRADMAHLMEPRHGNLHWNVRLKRDYSFLGVGRMVKPWFEWLFVFFPKRPDLPNNDRTLREWKEVVEDLIDDQTVSVEVLGVSKWNINETVAEEYSKGNM
jgi:2-polyprenyl-6-methoxyphenol hydroxylase-like FAD-dependent oxidoreductase